MTFDLDVILAAHGAGDDSPANDVVRACAARLEAATIGARVTAAFRLGTPSWEEALTRADRSHRVVVPLLTSDGYHAARLREVAASSSPSGSAPLVTSPVGTAAAFTSMVEQSLLQRGAGSGAFHVVVVGHGTTRHPHSDAATRSLAQAIAERIGITAVAAFLDQAPRVEDVLGALPPSRRVLVVPFLVGGGHHHREDLPARVAAARRERGAGAAPVLLLDAMRDNATLTEALDRALRLTREHRTVLRVGARGSRLSRRQVELVGLRLAPLGIDLRFTAFETRGDRDLSTPIRDFAEDPFTEEITDALRSGAIDLAVHSAKDLPLRRDPAIVDAAFLPRGASQDVLVSRGGLVLAELPAGACIGTSCERRSLQLRHLRPDVVTVPIRGTVPARVAAVDGGEVDAVILAAAGLERLGLEARIAERLSVETLVPAPAQGAIVIQCREDSPHLGLVRAGDDQATRRAVRAELNFAMLAARHESGVTAAHARSIGTDDIELRARLIDPVTGELRDCTARGRDPHLAGVAALELLLSGRPARVRGR